MTSVATLQASDTSNVVWTINGGANANEFIISADGELQFKESHAFMSPTQVNDSAGRAPGEANYEETYDNSANVYEVIVETTDEGGLTSTPTTARMYMK